ncbi:MAG: ABC transporter permease [Firmicutes bacterium HGW-Firmicutes-16]|nr:MAG: ABC transporter permease [Firmicutes bacterium HGW-Firmicutes-16]
MESKLKSTVKEVLGTVIMLALALLVGAVLVVISGNSPMEAYSTMLRGAFGSAQKICELFVELIPILLMAFGISVAFRAQLWNIGATGQFTIGAIAAAAVALYIPVPSGIAIPLSMIAAVVAAAFWAALAGWLKNRFNANEVITTLMLNYIANCFLLYLVNGPMQDPETDLSQSALVPVGMMLTRLFGDYRLHSGIFIMLIVTVIMFFFWKTNFGYRINLIGQGEKVATYAGVNVKRTTVMTMMLSGALIGLAGWIQIFGIQYRILSGIAGSYGDIATIVALLGALNPYGIIAAGVFFAALRCGGNSMQRMTDVPFSVVDVIEGLIIIFVIAKTIVNNKTLGLRDKFRRKQGGKAHVE